MQSHEPDLSLPANIGPRCNDGFFLAHPHPAALAALQDVVSRVSLKGGRGGESTVMYDELCGEKEEHRVREGRASPGCDAQCVMRCDVCVARGCLFRGSSEDVGIGQSVVEKECRLYTEGVRMAGA